nr:leucine rich repeat containing protein [Hymenolepis microstoma]
MNGTKEEAEHVEAAKQIIVERIEVWYAKFHPPALTTISRNISPPLRNITSFDLEATGLRALPSGNVLGALPCLRVLNLRYNKLRSLSGGLLQCRCLEELDLGNNNLKSIRGELKNLHCLHLLSVQRNSIESVNDTINELKQMHRIQQVDFRGNPLQEEENYAIKMWRALPSLTVLDSRTKFTDKFSFEAVKMSGKHEKAEIRKSKSNTTARICERYRRSLLRKVYVTQQIQVDKTGPNIDTVDNKILESSCPLDDKREYAGVAEVTALFLNARGHDVDSNPLTRSK